jgi:GNAT superfamily N-acetyltransferase
MAQLAHGDYVLDDNPRRVDLATVHRYLSDESYWAKGRSRDDVVMSIAGSARVVGAYLGEVMVGFARVITDGVTVAYLADVFVLPDHRGRGLGVELVRTAVEDGPFAGLRWMLHTEDAHELYQKFDFVAPSERVMERDRRP